LEFEAADAQINLTLQRLDLSRVRDFFANPRHTLDVGTVGDNSRLAQNFTISSFTER
jgi:hypothetical protein